MTEQYADSFYRGISPNCLHEDGYLLPETFKIDAGREDGFGEISITWNDNDEAFNVIASQKNSRTGQVQFTEGISKIETKIFVDQMKIHIINKNVDYERRPTENNKYHGNILVKDDLPKAIKTMLRSQFALMAQNCILDNPYATAVGAREDVY